MTRKINNLGLAVDMALKFYASLAKWLKLKVIKFWGLIVTFVEVTGEKPEKPPPPDILNRVKSSAVFLRMQHSFSFLKNFKFFLVPHLLHFIGLSMELMDSVTILEIILSSNS